MALCSLLFCSFPVPRPTRRPSQNCWSSPSTTPQDLEALDEVWQESEVLFGPDPNAGCPQVRDMLARMDTPITPAPDARHAAE